jgi:secreted trypsin-like serine protease
LAAAGTFPSLAYVEDHQGRGAYQCTGTVVAPNLVLTAAHCVENTSTEVERDPWGYRVTTGNVDVSSSEAQVSGVSEIIVNPSYDSSTGAGDAALLVLATTTAAPAMPLATEPPEGAPVKIVGWGELEYGEESFQSQLQWAESTLVSTEQCENELTGVNFEAELCVQDNAHYVASPCRGDSGGPLIAVTPTGEVDLGVADKVIGECNVGLPSIYARADVLAPWVQEARVALAPLSQAPPEAVSTTVTPGVYATVRSQTHSVIARVTPDGEHLIHLTAKANINCRHGNSATWGISALTFESDAVEISEGVVRESFTARPNRFWGAAHFGLYMRFAGNGVVEGRLRIRVKSPNSRVGMCYAPTVKFWAYRSGG